MLKTACLWSLNLDEHNAQQYILNVSSKDVIFVTIEVVIFLSFRENKSTKCIFRENFFKNLKGPSFHCQKCVDKNICNVVELPKNPQNPL